MINVEPAKRYVQVIHKAKYDSIQEQQADGNGLPKDLEKYIASLDSRIAELKAVVEDFKNSSSTSGNNVDIEEVRSLSANIAELKETVEDFKNSNSTSDNSVDIEKISEDIKKISSYIKDDKTATKNVEEIKTKLSDIEDYVENIYDLLPGDIEESVDEVKESISDLKLLDKKIDAVEKKFNGRFNEVIEPITEIKNNIKNFGEELKQIKQNTKKLSTGKKVAISIVVFVMVLSVSLGCGLGFGLPKGDLRYEYSAKYNGYIVYAKDYTMENLIIPSTYNGEKVVVFKGPKKDKNKNLKSVELPETLQEIEAGAFSGCSKLESITLPFVGAAKEGSSSANEKTLFGYIFGENKYDGSVQIQQKFGKTNTETKKYYIPKTLTEVTLLGGDLFYGAFWGCNNLTDVILKSKDTSIGPKAFEDTGKDLKLYCEFDESVAEKWDNNWNSQGNKVIWNWYVADNGISYTLKDGKATVIGHDSSALGKNVTIPSNIIHNGSFEVVAIGENAFNGCTRLTEIKLPSSLTSIGDSAFSGCSQLKEVAFENNSRLSSIGGYAFSGCGNLTSVEIPIETTSIGEYAFKDCTGLGNIKFDEQSKLDSIGTYAFKNCKSFTYIKIPISVTSIGGYAFSGCDALTIKCLASAEQSGWNINWSKHDGGYNKCPIVWNCNDNEVADDENIYVYANDNGVRLALKDGVATVVRQSKSISGHIKLWESYTYNGMKYKLKYIADSAFKGCVNLTSISIPSSITEIGADAFKDCQAMESDPLKGLIGVYITDIASWCSITFGNCYSNPLYYAHNLILNRKDDKTNEETFELLTTLVIPKNVSVSDYAFYNCTSLLCVYIKAGLSKVSIGSNAFYGCDGLISAYIPSNVDKIGKYAFDKSENLTISCSTSRQNNWDSYWCYYNSIKAVRWNVG